MLSVNDYRVCELFAAVHIPDTAQQRMDERARNLRGTFKEGNASMHDACVCLGAFKYTKTKNIFYRLEIQITDDYIQ